jgi:hypothetical protein
VAGDRQVAGDQLVAQPLAPPTPNPAGVGIVER